MVSKALNNRLFHGIFSNFYFELFVDGFEDAPMQVLGGSSPDEVPIPGEITMDIDTMLTEDMPNDLIIKLDLQKQDPFPLDVPCLNGLGSW